MRVTYESIEGGNVSCENNDLIERLLECEEELRLLKRIWIRGLMR